MMRSAISAVFRDKAPRAFAACSAVAVLLNSFVAWAGPPFVTDDPEPVEYRHWELYLASQEQRDAEGASGTAPHFELNYGAAADAMLHLIVPFAYTSPDEGPRTCGLGDVELGVKYRFVHETDSFPQVGTFPLAELPVGDRSRGLGEGHASAFLPIWLQKSMGPWTTYGGGGYWYHHDGVDKNYWQAGWELQREISKEVTLGAEIVAISSRAEGEAGRTAVNVGVIVKLSEDSHVLVSAGGNIGGPDVFFMYLAYQLTLGPNAEAREPIGK